MDFAFLPTAFIVYWILVYCRVGSLENNHRRHAHIQAVYCRVGSLEIPAIHQKLYWMVHYRVGSLEMMQSL